MTSDRSLRAVVVQKVGKYHHAGELTGTLLLLFMVIQNSRMSFRMKALFQDESQDTAIKEAIRDEKSHPQLVPYPFQNKLLSWILR